MSSGRRRKVARTLPQYYARSPRVAQILQSTFEKDYVVEVSKDFGAQYVECGKASELTGKITAAFLKTYGGPGFETTWNIIPLPDGNYLVAAASASVGLGVRPLLIMKIDDYGDIIWARGVGGGGTEHVADILIDDDGNYVFGASSDSFGAGDRDYMIMKMAPDGNIIWARTIGGPAFEISRGFTRSPDGGYVLIGNTSGFVSPTPQPLIVKLSKDLSLEWGKVIMLEYGWEAYGLVLDADNNYVAAGQGAPPGLGYAAAHLLKLDGHGDVVYCRRISGPHDMFGYWITSMRNGDYLIAGNGRPAPGASYDTLLIRATRNGEVVKAMLIGGTGDDVTHRARMCRSGGYIATCMTFTWGGVALMKLSEDLDLEWYSVIAGLPRASLMFPNDCCETHDGEYMMGARISGIGAGDWDLLLARFGRDGTIPYCPWAQRISPQISEPQYTVTDVSPTVIDVTDQLTMTAPTYQNISADVTVGKICILTGWPAFVEEWA